MQNKGNCGWDQSFVPVNGNWDFNMDGSSGCRQWTAGGRNRRRNETRCSECETACERQNHQADCRCERCGDARRVVCCDENTYIRWESGETEACACGAQQTCTGRADCPCEGCLRNRRSNGCQPDDRSKRQTCTGDAGCPCEACVRSRRRDSGCDACRDNNACACLRSAGCGNADDHAAAYAGGCKNRRVGMVNVEMQEIDEIFESESALRAGTLFPELHKPMNGYCPCDENCGTCAQAAAFAAWELRLYLNTHPNDKEALALFRRLCREAGEENYASAFLPDECCTNGWNWPRNPWPWEFDCRCGD